MKALVVDQGGHVLYLTHMGSGFLRFEVGDPVYLVSGDYIVTRITKKENPSHLKGIST